MNTNQHPLHLVADGFTFLEGPRWRDGMLWFSDFYAHAVWRIRPGQAAEKVLDVPQQPSGLGWLPDGRMLVVSMRDRKLLRREQDGQLVVHADLWPLCPWHCNDMVVAANGNAYVGNFGFDLNAAAAHRHTNLLLVRPDGTAQVVAQNLGFPNGSVITPDGKTLIVGESSANRISQFAILPDGTLGPRRDFAAFDDLGDEPDMAKRRARTRIVPDGMTLDAEGAVWFADAARQKVVRMAEGGRVLDEISTAPEGVFAAMLGGDDGKTLFLCVAPDSDEAARKAARQARLLSVRVAVPHAGLP